MRERNTIIQQQVVYQEAPSENSDLSFLLWLVGLPFTLALGLIVGVGWFAYKTLELTAKVLIEVAKALSQVIPYLVGLGVALGFVYMAWSARSAIQTGAVKLTQGVIWALGWGLVALVVGAVVFGLLVLAVKLKEWVKRARLKKPSTELSLSGATQPIIIVVTSEAEAERVRGLLETVPIQRAGLAFGTQPIQSTETARVEYHG